ncbi:Pescadillo N-terminus-domain-containing protein [Xylaria venustula]|nr:Pescadillo N-terminus-domain-containing protein [Xylaria venustula]
MGRIKKKGEAGNAKNYITRTQAVKKLQISLPDFRKLCIWKGIFPREPRNRKKASKSSTASTTFYYAKDIQFLLHEPLLQKFREQKTLEKKISKALGRGDVSDASRLERNAARPEKTGKPRYTLDHVIRDRYPTFVDALRDLDDCLSMLFLFANLPSTSTVPAKMIARCERLCLEFQHYLITSQSLRKSFLSIKGIYYQANIQGEDILWLVPYKFNQRVVGDVDFRIMGTFVEFYMTLLGFVNFRLYTSAGLKYPPKFDQNKDDEAAELGAFKLEGNHTATVSDEPAQLTSDDSTAQPDPKTQAEVNKLIRQMKDAAVEGDQTEAAPETDEPIDAIDRFEPAAPGGDVLPQPTYSGNEPGSLFANCTFYLSRETPRQPLEFILRAFGCKRIGWDSVLGEGAYTTNELDPSITHQIVDRPIIQAATEEDGDADDNQTSQKLAPNQRIPGRIYIQPQWVWDSVNDEELKQPNEYAPGAQLPPHLSPFVQNTQGAYDPTLPLKDQETEGEALEDSDEEVNEEEADEDEEEDSFAVKKPKPSADGMDVDASDDDEDEADDGSFGGFSEDEEDEAGDDEEEEDESESEERRNQQELEAELSGKPVKQNKTDARSQKLEAKKKLAQKAKEEADEIERAKGMLSKKKRKLFEQMQYTNHKKSAEDQKLRAKRRKLEKQKARGKA